MLRSTKIASGVVAAMLVVSNAQAQDKGQQLAPASPDPGNSGRASQLEEVVVTAQKKKENLQDVPISITAVTARAIEDLHATNLSDLQGAIPNVQLGGFSNEENAATFVIRGVGVSDADPYIGTDVLVVVDGVVQGSNSNALLDLYDIDRIEVLRGPQGTLFGANATGGVINVVTKQPSGAYGGQINVQAGNYNTFDVNASLDLPVIPDVLAARAVFFHDGRDGFYENIAKGGPVGGIDTTGGRGYLKFTPNADIDVTAIAENDRVRNGQPISVNLQGPGDLIPPSYHGVNFLYPSDVPDIGWDDIYDGTLTANWRSPYGTITSITGFRYFNQLEYTDDSGFALPLANTRRTLYTTQGSEEVRDDFKPLDGVEVLVGAFAMNTSYHSTQDFVQNGFLPGLRNRVTQHEDDLNTSGFVQGYWDVTPELRLQAGARATYEKIHMVVGNFNYLDPSGTATYASGGVLPGGFYVGGNHSWGLIGEKFGAEYHFLPDLSTYVTWSRGFKSGGFSGRIAIAEDIGPYNPEYVDATEVGIKSDWFDRRLRVNADLFYNDYTNQQLTSFYYVGRNESSTILNAGASHTEGAELEIDAKPFPSLTLNASGGYLFAQYDKFSTLVAGSVQNYAGRTLEYSPRFNGTLGASYRFPLGPGTANLQGQYSYTSPEYTDILILPSERINSVGLFSGNLRWSPTDGNWNVGLYCTNCANKHYVASALDVPGVFVLGHYGDPAEYGVDLKYSFGE